MKTVFQDVMGENSEIPFRVTLFPPEKMVSSVQRGTEEGKQCYLPCDQNPESL